MAKRTYFKFSDLPEEKQKRLSGWRIMFLPPRHLEERPPTAPEPEAEPGQAADPDEPGPTPGDPEGDKEVTP
jgi:hypothetical protein